MGFDTARGSAEGIISGWGSVPVAYDNVEFDSTAQDNWARITILDGDSFNRSLGGSCIRRTGIVVVQLFTKQWLGSSIARKYADELSVLFTNVRDGDVIYDVASVTRVGHETDFYQLNINIPFYIDEVLP